MDPTDVQLWATPDHLGKSTLRVDATEYHGVFTKQLGIERVQVCT